MAMQFTYVANYDASFKIIVCLVFAQEMMASDYLISKFSRLSTVDHSTPYRQDPETSERALLNLMDRTGYNMVQQNGQRKYGGPPPGWEGPVPPRGCEIFIGRIPRDCYEDELVPIFETMGKIYELRLMMDFSGSNRGYAFVMYTSKGDAQRAVREMNNYEIRKGRFLGVCQSVDNCRLFVGGIPKTKARDEIYEEMVKVTEGVVDVIVYPSATDKSKNRGFAFVEYDSHRAAAMARRKLIPGRIQLWGHQIAVDWAEPENEVDEDIMKTVKILYVRNLMLSTTEDHLEEVFTNAAEPQPPGKKVVERVKKLKDYAFVHFSEREEALRALKALNGKEIDGSKVEVVLAKPVDKNDPSRQNKNKSANNDAQQAALTASPFFPNMIPAFDPQTLNAYYAQLHAALPQSDLGLAGTLTASAPLMSRGLANRQQTPIRAGRGRGAAGSRAASARLYGARRKSSSPAEAALPLPLPTPTVDVPPLNYTRDGKLLSSGVIGVDAPAAAATVAASNLLTGPHKQSAQVLERLCQMLGWGIPVYQLNSTLSADGSSKEPVQLFLFKVVIPGIANTTPGAGTYVPNKVCRTVEEAQNYAAEYVLMSLGLPYDGTGGVYPAPVIPGVLPAAMQPLQMGALNYLGQPITAAQMPAAGMAGVGGANNPGMADLNMLSAAYSMQGVPGMVSAANLLHPNQYILNNDISSGLSTIQNAADFAQISVGAVSPPADINATASASFVPY